MIVQDYFLKKVAPTLTQTSLTDLKSAEDNEFIQPFSFISKYAFHFVSVELLMESLIIFRLWKVDCCDGNVAEMCLVI